MHVLVKMNIVHGHVSRPLYDFWCLHQHTQCGTPSACMTIHHVIPILYNSEWSSHIRDATLFRSLHVVSHSYISWIEIFSTNNWCISFTKFQELFNLILILVIDAWCFHPTSIHVSFSIMLTRLSDMQEYLFS